MDYETAHAHSDHHRQEILTSQVCGCFYCLAMFPPTEITEWIDVSEGVGQTALCPKCSIDSVIGSKSGCSIDLKFLSQMQKHWFQSMS